MMNFKVENHYQSMVDHLKVHFQDIPSFRQTFVDVIQKV